MGRYTVERYAEMPKRIRPAFEAQRVNRAHYRTNHHGYEEWSSVTDTKQERVLVHRLLAVAEYGFDAVCDKLVHHGPEAEIPWGNWPGNVQLMSRAEHMNHHHHPDRPAWDERVAMYEAYCGGGVTQPEVAEEYGVSKWVVQRSITRVAEERGETPPNGHQRKEQLSWADRVAMYETYRDEDTTHAEIAEDYGVVGSTVTRSIQKVREERR